MVSFYKYLGANKGINFRQFLMGDLFRQLWNDKYWFVRPQYEFIYDESDRCLVEYVGRFELLSVAMDHVGKRVGLQNVSLPHVNRSSDKLRSHDSGEAIRCEDTATRYLKQRKTMLVDYRTYYENDSISRVAELYKRDIETFGYEFDPVPKYPAVEEGGG
jgi:hypothetical protein